MVGSTKRSTRLAAKNTKSSNNNPKYTHDPDTDENDNGDNSSINSADGAAPSESEYSAEEEEEQGSDVSESSPVKTRTSARRRGKMEKQNSLEISSTKDDDDEKTSTNEKGGKNNNPPQSKTKSLLAYFTKKQPAAAGEELEVEDGGDKQQKCGKRKLSHPDDDSDNDSEEGEGRKKRSRIKGAENNSPDAKDSELQSNIKADTKVDDHIQNNSSNGDENDDNELDEGMGRLDGGSKKDKELDEQGEPEIRPENTIPPKSPLEILKDKIAGGDRPSEETDDKNKGGNNIITPKGGGGEGETTADIEVNSEQGPIVPKTAAALENSEEGNDQADKAENLASPSAKAGGNVADGLGCSSDLLGSTKDSVSSTQGASSPGGAGKSNDMGSPDTCESNNGSVPLDTAEGESNPPVTTSGEEDRKASPVVQLVADLVCSGENTTTSASDLVKQRTDILEGAISASSKERSRIVSEDPQPQLNAQLTTPNMEGMDVEVNSPTNASGNQHSQQCDSSSEFTPGSSYSITSIHYPQNVKNAAPSPSIGQLKMALYIEASKIHRGSGGGAERIFANYWETLERYITLGSHPRIQSSGLLSASFEGVEGIIKGFLKTKKLKRLHNKLVLAIMSEAIKTNIPSSCSTHIPQHWEARTIQQTGDKAVEVVADDAEDRISELQQWKTCFGQNTDIWMACGGVEVNPDLRSLDQSIQPSAIGSIPLGDFEDEAILPSARLPGALVIEPMVRKHAVNAGLTASEQAVWMLVVAVKDHSASWIKKAIANDKDLNEGCASQLPTHHQTSLACSQRQLTSAENDKDESSKVENSSTKQGVGKRVITSTSLAHVLDENHSAASRLTSMCAATTVDDRGNSTYAHLDSVNCIINSSIQRAASRRYKSSTEAEKQKSQQRTNGSPAKKPPSKTSTSKAAVPDRSLNNPKSAVIPPPVSLPPLNQPQLAAQRTGQPMPRLQPPPIVNLPQIVHQSPTTSRSQAGVQQLRNIQQQQAQQTMINHSDHKTNQQMKLPSSQQPPVPAPNVEPLTKPGFPSLTNTESPQQKKSPQSPPQKSPEQPANTSSPPKKVSSPPPRAGGRRGSKNLAAMMARPKPSPTKEDTSKSVEEKKENGSVPVDQTDATTAKPKEGPHETKVEANEKKEDTTKEEVPKPASQAPARGRGRGFGAKNLAAMRARASAGRAPSTDAGK